MQLPLFSEAPGREADSHGKTGNDASVGGDAECAPGLFAVPFGAPFFPSIARALLNGDLPRRGGAPLSPLALTQATVILPSRRAERALGEAFLKVSGREALLLPRIQAVSDRGDDLDFHLSANQLSASGVTSTSLALSGRVISDVERQMMLMTLVDRWCETAQQDDKQTDNLHSGPKLEAKRTTTPAQKAALAGELARLLDLLETENCSLAGIADLVPGQLSAQWETTVGFLDIIAKFWPQYCADTGSTTAAQQRNAIIRAEAERLTASPPQHPVIIAGISG
ncbi:MAG: hypothetical protein AAGG72_08725, partial [Pseudomonadota bacterium]